MPYWSLDDIPWHAFEASKLRPEHVALVRAACLVEHNSDDYADYLSNVFADDPEFQNAMINWAKEEVQHGMALRRWAELADQHFDFGLSFDLFTKNHHVPVDAKESVRGSHCGELIARCVVESGTSIYYTAIKENSEEPVLKAICAKIAADEYRHYQLFYRYLKEYQKRDKIGLLRRVAIAIERVAEISDNELACAFFSSQQRDKNGSYDQEEFANRYLACVSMLYDQSHIARMTAMVMKAVGLRPNGRLGYLATNIGWRIWRAHAKRVSRYIEGMRATPMPEPVYTQVAAAA